MKTVFVSTIHHRAHEYIKSQFRYQLWISTHPIKRFFYFKEAARLLGKFDLAVIETIYSLAYFWNYRQFLRTRFIPIVTSFPYVFLFKPEWYFSDTRATGFKVPKFFRKKILLRAFKLTKEGSVAYICVSKLVKNWLKEIDDKPTLVLYPAMDPGNAKEIDELREVSFNSVVFSYIGSGPQKGVDITLEVADRVLSEVPEAKFYLRVSKHVFKLYRKQFQEMINKHGKNRLILIFRRVSWKFLRSRASIYLQASYIEPFGVAVAEAMYARMIPVVANTVGAKELFAEQYPWLVASLDPQQLTKRILDVLDLSEQKKASLASELRKLASKVRQENLIKEFKLKFPKLLELAGYR